MGSVTSGELEEVVQPGKGFRCRGAAQAWAAMERTRIAFRSRLPAADVMKRPGPDGAAETAGAAEGTAEGGSSSVGATRTIASVPSGVPVKSPDSVSV